VIRCYNILDPGFIQGLDGEKGKTFKRLLFGLAVFHGVLLERKRFGPLGWNIQYGFSLSDFEISKDLLKMFAQNYDKMPIDALN